MAENENGSNGIGWFLAGLGIGALVGVLYAPKSGKETREELVLSAKEARDKANQYVEKGKEQLDEYVDRSRQYYERGRNQWTEYVEKGKGFVHEQQDKVAAAVEAGKQAYVKTTAEPSSEPTA
ncbi:YtxH domain-containing protein [Terriglobus tenax]|uniref:YtxH domain-containing protein n=1 Tax=Terriglobus tenax TaxID=1111115 RepID=UPI0021E049EA|nr:YtxH domain-containing protein [Terriglobus tenax]